MSDLRQRIQDTIEEHHDRNGGLDARADRELTDAIAEVISEWAHRRRLPRLAAGSRYDLLVAEEELAACLRRMKEEFDKATNGKGRW